MEEKYISVNRAVVVLKEKCEQGLIDFATADTIAGFIDKQPRADVQEVVRCKDCQFCIGTFTFKKYEDTLWTCSRTGLHLLSMDGFCSWGMRTDGE